MILWVRTWVSDSTCHQTSKGWEGGAKKQGQGGSENLSGKSISMSIPVWVSYCLLPTGCVGASGKSLYYSTPDWGVEGEPEPGCAFSEED